MPDVIASAAADPQVYSCPPLRCSVLNVWADAAEKNEPETELAAGASRSYAVRSHQAVLLVLTCK